MGWGAGGKERSKKVIAKPPRTFLEPGGLGGFACVCVLPGLQELHLRVQEGVGDELQEQGLGALPEAPFFGLFAK